MIPYLLHQTHRLGSKDLLDCRFPLLYTTFETPCDKGPGFTCKHCSGVFSGVDDGGFCARVHRQRVPLTDSDGE